MAEIGKRIKSRREELGITQEGLAKALGYKNKSTIAKIENGTNDITQSRVVDFAAALLTTTAYLMGWEESHREEPQHQDPDQAVLDLYHRLDSTDQAKVVERMEVLLEADKYAKGKESQAG